MLTLVKKTQAYVPPAPAAPAAPSAPKPLSTKPVMPSWDDPSAAAAAPAPPPPPPAATRPTPAVTVSSL